MSRASALGKLENVSGRVAKIERQRDLAVVAAMEAGCTWAEIGAALGMSAQGAHRRFRWIRHSPVTGEVWWEAPLPV